MMSISAGCILEESPWAGKAIVFTNVDTRVSEQVIREISAIENIISVTQVSFSDE